MKWLFPSKYKNISNERMCSKEFLVDGVKILCFKVFYSFFLRMGNLEVG